MCLTCSSEGLASLLTTKHARVVKRWFRLARLMFANLIAFLSWYGLELFQRGIGKPWRWSLLIPQKRFLFSTWVFISDNFTRNRFAVNRGDVKCLVFHIRNESHPNTPNNPQPPHTVSYWHFACPGCQLPNTGYLYNFVCSWYTMHVYPPTNRSWSIILLF